jgi:hypothetical protein
MNIHRYHIDSHPFPAPHTAVARGPGDAPDTSAARPATRTKDDGVSSGVANRLVEWLANVPEVRADVVAAARVKVASGELLTRAAAEDTAAAFYRQDSTFSG